MVITRLVELDDTPILGRIEKRQRVTRLQIRLQEPHTCLEPVVIVSPGIHQTVARHGNPFHHCREHRLTIHLQDGFTDTIMITRVLHIVVGP